MKTNIITLIKLTAVSTVLITACQKSDVVPVTKSTAPAAPPVTTAPSSPATTTGRVLNVGTGSGKITIDGTAMGLKANDVVKVKAGTYSYMDVQNINTGGHVTIQNNGLVTFSNNDDQIHVTNVSNVTISGAGTSGISKGFVCQDDPQHKAIVLNGTSQDLTIQNFSFNNIGDYTIFNNGQTVYDGSTNSSTNNLKILNVDATNIPTGFIELGGEVTDSHITGLVRNLEIANLNFTNSNCGIVVFLGNADNYNIHNNVINNINTTNNNHNGIFEVKGSGQFHNNLVKNHQGNAIRAWARSFGSTPKDVLIYNNVVFNSRKYSAFEVQSFQDEIISGKTTYANAKVYNNTCGNLNLSQDWIGVVVDVYNLFGGTCNVYNNIGFNFPAPNRSSNIVNQQGSTTPVLTNNKYYASAAAAGINDLNSLTAN